MVGWCQKGSSDGFSAMCCSIVCNELLKFNDEIIATSLNKTTTGWLNVCSVLNGEERKCEEYRET